jgi:excisionase family DNA binding protein
MLLSLSKQDLVRLCSIRRDALYWRQEAATMQDEPILTVAEVAARLKISQETVRIWLRQGKMRGYRPGGDKIGWRVPQSEIRRLLQQPPSSKN